MDEADRDQLEKVLRRIPSGTWEEFLATPAGRHLRRRLHAIDEALAGVTTIGTAGRTVSAARIAQLLGYGVMQDPKCGPWIREQLLRRVSGPAWVRLLGAYAALDSRKTVAVRRNASQGGSTPAAVAAYWHQGGTWSRLFCETFALPAAVWQRKGSMRLDDEDVVPSEPLPPLHDFQRSAYTRLRELLARRTRGLTALLSLPTGAGKTRVVVEAICDYLAESAGKGGADTVLWIAHSAELQSQAWECFREVWQVPPHRTDEAPIRRVQPLRLVRLWGGRDPDTIGDEGEGPEVLVASVDQLASWCLRAPEVVMRLRARRFVSAVVDEAHGVITNEFRTVLEALGFKAEHRWLPASGAPLLVGLTATPWRKADDQDAALRRFFSNHLVTPAELGRRPVARLQDRGILSRVVAERVRIPYVPPMTARQWDHVERFHELPAEYLDQLAEFADRNREILRRVQRLGSTCKTLVFACSIEHAEMLAACINATDGSGTAAAITSATPRTERALVIEQFRGRQGPRVLCTVGVLAAGFDAPKVGAVVITRPTMSAALYEQMVGRGLRGPMNGGTSSCKVIDVQDDGLPEGILSYERVIGRWSEGGAATPSQNGRPR
jgi:superfamily II DNA or RNA helicase